MEFATFINWERRSRDTIDVKKIYIDMADDLVAGVLLSQLVYWYLPSKAGKSKISILRDGKEWIAKQRHDWWYECRISPKQVDRAIKLLVEKGIVETELFKFNNIPTKHIRIVKDVFLTKWESLISTDRENPFLPKGENGLSPKGENHDFTQRAKSITKTTEKTKPENTSKENQSSSISVDSARDEPTSSEPTPQKDDDDLTSTSPDTKISQEQINKHMPAKSADPPPPPPLPSDQPDGPLYDILAIWKTVKATPNVAEDVDLIYDDMVKYNAPIVKKMLRHIEKTKGGAKVYTWNYVHKALVDAYPEHKPAESAPVVDVDTQIERAAQQSASEQQRRNAEFLKYANNAPDELPKAAGE